MPGIHRPVHLGRRHIAVTYSVQFREKHHRVPHSFGEALAGLNIPRKAALDIFIMHLREQGTSEEAARRNAEASLKAQYDPAVAKFRQKK